MASNGWSGGLSAAASYASETLLRSLGGVQVKLVVPIPYAVGMTEQALALVLPEIEEVMLEPVLVRVAEEAAEGKRAQYELLIPAKAVKAVAEARQMASGEELLRLARAIIHNQQWLRMLNVTTDYCGGAPYLYRVRVMERSDASSEG